MHSEGYRLFASFFWLIFPIGFGIVAILQIVLRHKRAQQALEIVKGYADQGKEIPPELMKVLQRPERGNRSPQERARNLMIAGFINAAFAAAFLALTIGNYLVEGDRDAYGLVFVVVLFAGFSAAFLASSWIISRDRQDSP